ncbi:AlpA family transcriptional regulator [Salmonella enterica subsp. enterica serovar Newport]|uniref:AlpA family transcriptional regulator n=1 Tax=Salmonella enterica I TaxID=59201 RepID=A0A3V2NSG8_SALET|nr:AlpA family transcriptional regulator [Salmonella enterica subsp. enterica serovar Newport]EAC1425880.1 AlpA family transcriptional regulator [Escherichia coli]EBX0575999.1 AlpA family transcriptional regulator [Salmonella enterica subsp. enterica serovar Utah]EEZ9779402.1 AlpA family transcriptional regulator [Escherichia coli O25]EBR9094532.1 AlpA family transcriptional regulator [Salmonella enterica subsp. enterica serovar Newport]
MHAQSSSRPTEKLIRFPKVIEMTGRSRTRIYADIKSETFPKPIRIGPRSIAWVEQEIIDWLEERKKQRFQA